MNWPEHELPRPRVVFWTNAPAPYTVDRFNAVVRRGQIDLVVWFESRAQCGRRWNVQAESWAFEYAVRPSLSRILRRRWYAEDPDLLVALYYIPRMLAGTAILRNRCPTSFALDGPGDGWARRRTLKEWVKRAALPRADSVFCAGPETAGFAEGYGVSPSRILDLPHSVDRRYLEASREEKSQWRASIRQRLGLTGVVFLYVGRLWRGKGLDDLLEAFAGLSAERGEVHLLLLGDGVDEHRYRAEVERRGLDDVHFVGFTEPERLILYYAAADVFVFPSLGDPYGLVVDEAMAMGLPVIGTTAVGEMTTRVEGGYNGFIVVPGDPETLATAMQTFIDTPDLAQEMGAKAAKAMRGRSPDDWAAAFEDGVRATLAMRR